MSHPTLQERVSFLVDAIESPRGESRRIDYWTLVYTTTGGSRMVASTPESNDDGRAHDLVLVHPAPLNGEHVVVLRTTVDPEWSTALAVEVAARRAASEAGKRHDERCMNGPNCRMRDWHIRNDFGGR